MADILVLNGPNLNLLGQREPSVYGHQSLESIMVKLGALAQKHGRTLTHFQSNQEGILVDQIHQAYQDNIRFIIINAGAYTHTSIALRDALLATGIPFIEVHLSNIYQRESFRHGSYLADIACGTICGLGSQSYELALLYAFNFCKNKPNE